MMLRKIPSLLFVILSFASFAQLPVARDTITVIENGYVLKMPWANGINFSNVSSIDLNWDNKKDLVVFDRLNIYGVGRFRCFINIGNSGELKYKEDWSLSYAFPQVSNWAVFKDYNCDGKEDLFCATSGGIRVYKNVSTVSNFSLQLVKPLIYSDYGNLKKYNLYASSVGVPGIVDIDGDGDLDVLTFSAEGTFIQYHKNLSMETYAHCDSLVYEYTDRCWGKISESNCEVNMNQCPLGKGIDERLQKVQHAGSCLSCLDSDGDGDQDLIMGDISCQTLEYVHNTGSTFTAALTDTTKLYPNYPNKGSTLQVKLNSFPCAYHVDADGDSKKDLIVTPNSAGSENAKSVWLYRNTSTTNTVNFQFVKNNFLQDEMIEVGQNSYPVIFDYDQDGLKDLLIGNYGYYTGNSLSARLTLYKNTGSATLPTYSLISRDYCSLSTRTLTNGMPLNNVVPTIGDVDGDGDQDMCIGTSNGQIHWLENTAGPGNPCNFSVFKQNPFNFTTSSGGAAPQLFDLDGDGKLDLLIGMQNGNIAWYKNKGTALPSFSLMTNSLGNVDVKTDPGLFGYDGYAVPFFYRDNSTVKLLVGSFSGYIFQYDASTPLASSYIKLSSRVNAYNEGTQSTLAYEDVNGDGKRDLIIGNGGGGLNFFSSNSIYVDVKEYDHGITSQHLSLFPNPNKGLLNFKSDWVGFQKASLVIFDITGKALIRATFVANNQTLDISDLNAGIYFVNIQLSADFQTYNFTKKIIKE